MAAPLKDIATLHDPSHIKKTQLASSPYVLRRIFAADPTIQRLIAAGRKIVPLIAAETRKAQHLDEITLAAFAFIIENVNPEAAPQIFRSRFRKSIEKPGPFFVHFAAHAIRTGLRLSVKPLEMVYTRAELMETENMLR